MKHMLHASCFMKKRLVISGLGFGGLYTFLYLHCLGRETIEDLEIVLINRTNYFLFTPLLYEVATGGVGQQNIIQPIRQILKCCVADFCEAEIQGVDLQKQAVKTSQGEVSYDYLVLALGSTTNFYNVPGAREHVFTLKDLVETRRLKNHLIQQFAKVSCETDLDARRETLRFVIVGGGPTGVELAIEMVQYARQLTRVHPNVKPEEIEIVLLHKGLEVVPSFDRSIQRRSLEILKKQGVIVRLNEEVRRVTETYVELSSGEQILTNTVVWAASVIPAPLDFGKEFPEASLGARLPVEKTLQLQRWPNVFVVGDQAKIADASVPVTAQAAVQEAKIVARNIVALNQSNTLKPFAFHHRGDLVSLGRGRAVAYIFGISFDSWFAWWLWRTVYLMELVGWGNRVRVVVDWTLDLFHPRDMANV